MKKDTDRHYRTTALSLAIFLFAKDQCIAGINSVDSSGKKEFVFVRTDYLEELIDKYRFADRDDPDRLVEVRTYENARSELMDRLFE